MAAQDNMGTQWAREWDPLGDSPSGIDLETASHRQRTVSMAIGSRSVSWEKQPLQEFHPDELRETQAFLWKEKHESVRAAPSTAELPPVHVVKIGNEHYLRDGHHRHDLARERGQKVKAHVLDSGLPWSKVP